MKVVIVNEALAYPTMAGNWLRTVNLMLPLARRHDIVYVCRGVRDPAAVETARAFYADHGIRPIITSDPPPENLGRSVYWKAATNLFSPLPYSIAAHRSPLVRREIARLAASGDVDLWQFESLSYADTLTHSDAPTIITEHNVESLIWERMCATESNAAKRWYIRRQWKKYERYERNVLKNATRVVAVSHEDAALLASRFGVAGAAVVDNGVDVKYFAGGVDRRLADPREILFLGALNWRPNLDSIHLLLDSIMPAVIAEEPLARLRIVGRNPPPALVKKIRAHRFAELHQDVPDVRPYLSSAGVLAVPLRIGGGSRLKILEATAAAVPVVTTRVGCEGLIFQPGRDLVVVDDHGGMAAALVDAIRHPERGAAMARNGKALIDAHYEWSRLADRLEQVWEECVASRPVPA